MSLVPNYNARLLGWRFFQSLVSIRLLPLHKGANVHGGRGAKLSYKLNLVYGENAIEA